MEPDKVVSSEKRPSCTKRCRCRLVVFLVILAVIAAGVGVAWYQISGKLRISEPYKEALAAVQKDPKVIERLGEPIRDTWLPPSGSVYGVNAELTFKVAGPKGQASVRTEARKIGGKWALRGPDVTFADGKHISLDTAAADGGEGDAPKWTPKAPSAAKPSGPQPNASTPSAAAPSAPNLSVETPDLPPLTSTGSDIKVEIPDMAAPAKAAPEKKGAETKPPAKK
jgi:hypothetical protein